MFKRSGALKQIRQLSAVDLRSNGHGCTHAPWTAPCARRTGPRWTVPLKRKGYLIWAVRARSDGPGHARAGATASTPECGGARQGLAGASPGRRSRPSSRPRLEQNAARALAHVTKGSGGRSGLTCGRHRKGAARPLRRARGDAVVREIKGNWAGGFAHCVQRKKAGSRAERRRQRRGSTTAAARAALR
jgi:hypothetical protein